MERKIKLNIYKDPVRTSQ